MFQYANIPYFQKKWREIVVHNSKIHDLQKWQQDEIDDYGSYLTEERVEELLTLQNGQCTYCSTTLRYGAGVKRNRIPNGLTVERVDNNVPHVIENCLLACSSCNTARGAFYSHDEFKEHYANIKLRLVKKCRGSCTGIMSTTLFYTTGNRYRHMCRKCDNVDNCTRRAARKALTSPY
jgi:5-methylcytosine-specific restriction endonuclease McrA